MSTVTRTAIRRKKPIVQSGCAQRRSKESGTTGALEIELYRLSSLKVFALKDGSLFVCKLLPSNPYGFDSSLGEGASGETGNFTVLPRAPSQRGLSPQVTGGVGQEETSKV